MIWSVLAIAVCVGLALAARKHETYKNFSYALFIIAAVITAMSFPQYFLSVGDFKFTLLIVPLLQIIMFGMGSQLSTKDFVSVIRQPKAVFIGLVCQFSIMPLVALLLTTLFVFPPEIAAGVILVGCSPSGLASNVMSYLAKANVALSITLTAIASLLAPVLTPFLMKGLIGQLIPLDPWNMMIGIFDIVILPILAGFIFNSIAYGQHDHRRNYKQVGFAILVISLKNLLVLIPESANSLSYLGAIRFDLFWFLLLPVLLAISVKNWFKLSRKQLDNALALVSMVGIGMIIVVITAAGRDSLLQIGKLLILVCLIHNLMGYGLGYWICRFFGLDQASCRTIALEVGMQNGGLASGIAVQMGKAATVGLASSVFGPMMNITGSSLALWWRGKDESQNKENDSPIS